MHEAALAAAALPPPAIVLGMALKPYAIGHELFLIREENPFAIYGGGPSAETVRPSDLRASLAAAVLVCCQTFSESRGLPWDVLLGLKLALWRRRTKGLNTETESLLFRQYQLHGNIELRQSNILRPGHQDSRAPGAPFLLRLYQFLVFRGLATPDGAWDYPLGLAKMQWQTYHETEGSTEIENEMESDFNEYVAEQEAKERNA